MECLIKISVSQFPILKFNNTPLPQTQIYSSLDSQILHSSCLFRSKKKRKSLTLVATSCSNNDHNGLTVPLVPTTEAGRSLCGMLMNDRDGFYGYVEKELVKLAALKNDALLRSVFSVGSDEVILHWRISELTKLESRKAVEDIMYMLIAYKFSEIGVHLVPKLSNCMYNGRLEIWPRKDWELESIHSGEVLELVKEIGWEYKSNVKDNWALTRVQKLQIRRVYAASVLYGYFLKSASLRYRLERSLDKTPSNLLFSRSWPLKQKSIPIGHVTDTGPTMSVIEEGKRQDNLRSYVTSLDDEVKCMWSKPKFKESMSVIEKHCSALFGDESDEEVSTSLASLKRLVLEAVAFGSFLWDAEDYVRAFYRLEEN